MFTTKDLHLIVTAMRNHARDNRRAVADADDGAVAVAANERDRVLRSLSDDADRCDAIADALEDVDDPDAIARLLEAKLGM